jgi:hypothetical protein
MFNLMLKFNFAVGTLDRFGRDMGYVFGQPLSPTR